MKIAIQADNNLFVSAEGGGDNRGDVHANRTEVKAWETFTLQRIRDKVVAFQTSSGRFLCAESGGGDAVRANRARSDSADLTIPPELRTAIGPWESFTLVGDAGEVLDMSDLKTGRSFRLKTVDGVHFVSARRDLPDIPLNATRTEAFAWEIFRAVVVEADVVAPKVVLGPLHADGVEIKTADGKPWFGLGVTSFTLLQTWLDRGEGGVAPWADWMIKSGLQFGRSAGCYNGGIGRFIPSDYGTTRYLEGLRTLGAFLRSRGLRCKLTTFCDMQSPDLSKVNQPAFFADVCAAIAEFADVFIIDAGNEVDKNGVDVKGLRQPAGLLSSRGSPLSDGTPPFDPWSVFDTHDTRNDTWPKGAKSGFEIQNSNTSPPQPPRGMFMKPWGSDEMIGIGPNNEPGRTTNSPEDVFDYIAAPFGSYRVLHVRALISQLDPAAIDRTTQACIDAGVQAARVVPAEWRQLGQYTRGGLPGFPIVDSPLESPDGDPVWWLRAYGRIRGDRTLVAILRPRPDRGMRVQSIDGRPIQRFGDRKNVLIVG